MSSYEEQLNQIRISLLQLQRSALLDTQTVMQLMLDKGICQVEDIVSVRSKIESESKDIERIDSTIVELGGNISAIPQPDCALNKADTRAQLRELGKLIQQLSNDNLV